MNLQIRTQLLTSSFAYLPDLLAIRVWLPVLASARHPLPGIRGERATKFLRAVRVFLLEYRMSS